VLDRRHVAVEVRDRDEPVLGVVLEGVEARIADRLVGREMLAGAVELVTFAAVFGSDGDRPGGGAGEGRLDLADAKDFGISSQNETRNVVCRFP
jgi:hypothetical protein